MAPKNSGAQQGVQPEEKTHDKYMFWVELAQDVLGLIGLSLVLFLILLI